VRGGGKSAGGIKNGESQANVKTTETGGVDEDKNGGLLINDGLNVKKRRLQSTRPSFFAEPV